MGIGQKARTFAMWCLLSGSQQALAFVSEDADTSPTDQALRLSPSLDDDQVTLQAALQIRQKPLDGLGLQDPNTLLGETGVTPERVLRELAPHLDKLVPELLDRSVRGTAVHEVFQLKHGFWAVAHGRIELHHYGQKLVLLRVRLPHLESLSAKHVPTDFKSLTDLPIEAWRENLTQVVSYQVLAAMRGELTPAWEVRGFDSERGAMIHRIIDAKFGTILDEQAFDFDLTTVYSKNPKEGRMVDVALPDLSTRTTLDGKYFSVFSPDNASPRALGQDGDFSYRPNTDDDAIHFDEVQTYYHASNALHFFRDKFGFDVGSAGIKIRVHHDMNGKPDNAYYVPNPSDPEIRIGRGERLKNLARDVDVVTHEYAHHVIYRHLKETKGEAGILHEGTADYFTYAISGDPFLGESVSPSEDYVRTATTIDKDNYDLLPASTKNHVRGSYWSAVLWEIRENVGSEYADLLVYESLPYLGHSGTIKDGFLGLLSADRDLSAKAQDNETPLYGEQKCTILKAGIKLGFASFLEDFDGSPCGLDLPQLAKDNQALKKERENPRRKANILRAPIKACGTVSLGKTPDEISSALLVLMLMTPAILGLFGYRRVTAWI